MEIENKLEVGMIFSNLKKAFQFLGIENEYYGQEKSKNLKFSEYCNWHRINKHSLIIDEVFSEKKNLFVKRWNFSDEELKENFINLYNRFDRVPTYNEFIENTNISLQTYVSRFNLRGIVYDVLIEKYFSKEERERYRNKMDEYRSKINKERDNSIFQKYTDEDLKNNFCKIFDSYISKYNVCPTRRIFNISSQIDESVYRHRFNKKWSEICKYYGYESNIRFKSEYLALEICKKIFNEDYKHGESFEWLINSDGYHLFYDGYFENLKIIIEFDGKAHRTSIPFYGGKESFEKRVENDLLKDRLVKEHGLIMIRIDSRLNWNTEEGMLEIIKNELSKNGITYEEILKRKNK